MPAYPVEVQLKSQALLKPLLNGQRGTCSSSMCRSSTAVSTLHTAPAHKFRIARGADGAGLSMASPATGSPVSTYARTVQVDQHKGAVISDKGAALTVQSCKHLQVEPQFLRQLQCQGGRRSAVAGTRTVGWAPLLLGFPCRICRCCAAASQSSFTGDGDGASLAEGGHTRIARVGTYLWLTAAPEGFPAGWCRGVSVLFVCTLLSVHCTNSPSLSKTQLSCQL